VDNRGRRALVLGRKKEKTFLPAVASPGSVYNSAVIPPELTERGRNSFPEPVFFHCGGKAGKTLIQRAWFVVKYLWNTVYKPDYLEIKRAEEISYPRIHRDNSNR